MSSVMLWLLLILLCVCGAEHELELGDSCEKKNSMKLHYNVLENLASEVPDGETKISKRK